jgi:hypothetical protein
VLGEEAVRSPARDFRSGSFASFSRLSTTSPVYLRLRKDCGIAAKRR